MSQNNRPKDKRSWKEMSQRQMERAIAVGGCVLLVVVIAFIFMFNAWGLAGTLWRLLGLAILSGSIYLVWRNRGKIAAYIAKRQQEAAARKAAVAAAWAAAEARRPRPIRGSFPPEMTFLGQGTSLTTDHGILHDPLIYVAASASPAVSEPSLLDAGLPVAPIEHAQPGPLPYWPSYAQASPDQRAVYLHWLISGRKQRPPEIGYAFMYFYGLERRTLLDGKDYQIVVDEVLRLRQLDAGAAAPNHSFDTYTAAFLWLLVTVRAECIKPQSIQTVAESTRSWNEDNLSSAVSWFAQANQPIPGWMAFIVANHLPGSQRSVVINRVEAQFRELFIKRYADRFKNGMMVTLSKRHRVYKYKPASAVIGVAEATKGPNPFGLQSQFQPLVKLWNSCIDELRRLSYVVRQESQQLAQPASQPQLTSAMWEALPGDIRATTDHPMLDHVCRFVQESTDDEGHTLIGIGKLAVILGADAKERYSLSESVWISRTTKYCGYCLEPDPRLTGHAYHGDDTVTAFLRITDEDTNMVRYRAAACMLQFGMVVASADENVREDELTAILQAIEQLFQLNEQEHRRLEVLRNLLLIKGADLSGLRQFARLLAPEHRQAISKLLLIVAAQDGEVTEGEIGAIRRCYKTLGFDQSEIGQAIESLRAYQNDDEPVTIQPGTPGLAGEPVPTPKLKSVLRLNRAAIAQIMADTREVAQLLADAMNAGEQIGQTQFSTPFVPPTATTMAMQAVPPHADQTPADAVGMAAVSVAVPVRFASFYQLLISKQEWDVKEIDGVARQQGLMLSGAIDTLNEWAAEKFGGQLFVEDGGKIIVEQAYLN